MSAMFKFLKDKLSKAVSLFSKKVEDEGDVKKEDVVVEEPILPKEDIIDIDENEKPFSEPGEVVDEKAILEESERIKEEEENAALELQKQRQEEENRHKLEEQRILAEKLFLEKKFQEEKNREAERLELERKKFERASVQEEILKIKKQEQVALEKKRLEEEVRHAKELILLEEKKREEELLLKQEKERLDEAKKAEKKGFLSKIFSKKKEEPIVEKIKQDLVLDKADFDSKKEDYSSQAEQELELSEKKGFFEKIKESITTVKLSEDKFNELFWDLEVTMLENNVAVEVIEKIREDLKRDLTAGKIERKTVEQIVHESLKASISDLFSEAKGFDLVEKIRLKSDKPFVISFIGVNGSGKTTTMAKVANMLLKNKFNVVFAASDTFRAAAIQQLQEHADKLGVKLIKHDYESDPAAVAFDAIKHAKAKGIDVVLIDTAGRLHTNDNLMNELKKLIRVNQPDLKIFIGEAITGNDCVEQAKLFNEAVGIDAIILAKADVDEKGGAALSVSFVTKKPILYLGTGQAYDDLMKFDKDLIIKNIGL